MSDNVTSWHKNLPEQPDNNNFIKMISVLSAIQYDKEKYYGSSWKGKGEYRGIMSNIDRKYDRLDKMTADEILGHLSSLGAIEKVLKQESEDPTQGSQLGEGKVDAIADLANYCILYLSYVYTEYPLVFNEWVSRNVPMYMQEKINSILNPHSEEQP